MVLSEGSVASGIRRIEALTGKNAFEYLRQKKSETEEIREILKTENAKEKLEKMLGDIKSLEKEIQKLKTVSSVDSLTEALKNAHEQNGVRVVKVQQDGLNTNELRLVADNIKDRLKSGIIIITSVTDGNAAIVCMVTKDLTDKYHAGEIVKQISKAAGGKGGGKPEMAQGGTKDMEKLNTALESLYDIVKSSSGLKS